MKHPKQLARNGLVKLASAVINRLGPDRIVQTLEADTWANIVAAIIPALGYNKYFDLWQRRGFHVTPVHYYQPIPDTSALSNEVWQQNSGVVGVDLRPEAQFSLLDTFSASFRREYDALPYEPTAKAYQYYFKNEAFCSVDAEILYCMIRHYKPRRVLEIGSGFTTLISAQAIQMNRHGNPDYVCDLVAIEPYPNEILKKGFPGLTSLVPAKVQDVPLATFAELGENDILFIDSTHVLRIGSDVHYEFLEILPRLAGGVIVHVHDIFMPAEYPREWVMDQHRFWTEQYLLQAFLAFNKSFEILWAGSWMHLRHPERLERAFKSYDRNVIHPASFWIRKSTD